MTIYQGDALEVLRQLPDGIVQTCVTSPPYWGLRCYGVEGQLGLEPTPDEFIVNMVELFGQVRRVLRDDATLWLNLGDSYAGAPCGSFNGGGFKDASAKSGGRDMSGVETSGRMDKLKASGLKPKDLCGMPWRVALALQADGWYLRSPIVWRKPNPMPESCTDRPTKSYEHIFLMSKKSSYYYDADAVREDVAETTLERDKYTRITGGKDGPYAVQHDHETPSNPAGRNMRDVWSCEEWHLVENTEHDGHKTDVWTVATAPYSGAHFATFPPKLIEPCILAGANDRACAECGKAWRRVVDKARTFESGSGKSGNPINGKQAAVHGGGETHDIRRGPCVTTTTIGHEPDCKCGTKETRPSIVLDPFMGSGTTAEVARKHGCDAIGIELNAEYIDLAAKRLAQGVLDFSTEASTA